MAGDRFFRGPSGASYRFGRGANARQPVQAADAEHFLTRYAQHFRIVPAEER